MTTPCLRLDDYLDGRLSDADAEAFETHTLDCSTCDAALGAAALDLSSLRDVTCPPAVLDAALRSARRAPDRAPAVRQRTRRRFVVAPLALLAALAVAIGVSQWGAPDGPTGPASAPVAVVPEAAVPEPAPSGDDPLDREPLAPAVPAPAAPAPEDRVADAAPPSPPPAAQETPSLAPIPEPDAPRVDLPEEPIAQATPPTLDPPDETEEPTAEEIEAAREDLALAFHLVAEAQSQARAAVRAEAGPVSSTIGRALPF